MIRQTVRRGGTFVICALLALSAFAAFGMSQIRLGGPLHERQKLTGEYLADILPPPQYVIEPMLEVTRIVQDPASLDLRRHRLAELERVYHDRSRYWAASELDGDLKQRHEKDAMMQADRFWQLVDTELLPAVERGDMEAAARVYRKADAFLMHIALPSKPCPRKASAATPLLKRKHWERCRLSLACLAWLP